MQFSIANLCNNDIKAQLNLLVKASVIEAFAIVTWMLATLRVKGRIHIIDILDLLKDFDGRPARQATKDLI